MLSFNCASGRSGFCGVAKTCATKVQTIEGLQMKQSVFENGLRTYETSNAQRGACPPTSGFTDVRALRLPDRIGPCTSEIWQAVVSIWPEHEKFLRASFANRSDEVLDTTDLIAALLLRVCRSIPRDIGLFAKDYRFYAKILFILKSCILLERVGIG